MDTDLSRSHYCADLSEDDMGSPATVSGWVQRTRDMGGIIFVDLRDRTGILQVVFDLQDVGEETFAKVEALRSEYVIKVKGTVRRGMRKLITPIFLLVPLSSRPVI